MNSWINTIVLLKGTQKLTNEQYKEFQKGDTIWGESQEPEELKRWNLLGLNEEQREEVKKMADAEMAKHRCIYSTGNCVDITEYALMYCECDEDGEFLQGSDYDIAGEVDSLDLPGEATSGYRPSVTTSGYVREDGRAQTESVRINW